MLCDHSIQRCSLSPLRRISSFRLLDISCPLRCSPINPPRLPLPLLPFLTRPLPTPLPRHGKSPNPLRPRQQLLPLILNGPLLPRPLLLPLPPPPLNPLLKLPQRPVSPKHGSPPLKVVVPRYFEPERDVILLLRGHRGAVSGGRRVWVLGVVGVGRCCAGHEAGRRPLGNPSENGKILPPS